MNNDGIKKWSKLQKAENKRQQQKDKIKNAFKDSPNVEIIPAKNELKSNVEKLQRVAAYCRVSTYEESQAGSFELQCQYYREKIENNPEWELADIYGDEGVSATSIKKRTEFLRMINDSLDGKIDLILTKDISRFARNTRDCLDAVRQLKAREPPVPIIFEAQNINTVESKSEFILGILSLMAQADSEQKSAAITWSVIERFKKGIPIISTHNLLGYDKDRFGKMIVVEEEADVIRKIYASYLKGYNAAAIAKMLMSEGIPTALNRTKWSGSSVLNILRNEKMCGAVIMQKSFTLDCFSHKRIKNTGQRPKYRLRDHHPAIIARDDWEKVQTLLQNRQNRTVYADELKQQRTLPVSRVKTGALKGFVLIDLKWKNWQLRLFYDKFNLKYQNRRL